MAVWTDAPVTGDGPPQLRVTDRVRDRDRCRVRDRDRRSERNLLNTT